MMILKLLFLTFFIIFLVLFVYIIDFRVNTTKKHWKLRIRILWREYESKEKGLKPYFVLIPRTEYSRKHLLKASETSLKSNLDYGASTVIQVLNWFKWVNADMVPFEITKLGFNRASNMLYTREAKTRCLIQKGDEHIVS